MRVAVVGAGVGGLAAAHRLGRLGHECDVYERGPTSGGHASTIDAGGGVRIERFHHHVLRSDRHLRDLLVEIGLSGELEWHPSSLAIFSGDRSYPLTSTADLLRFRPLSIRSRLRVARAVRTFDRTSGPFDELDRLTARDWAVRSTGRRAYDQFWSPLLRVAFGERADEVSMAWLSHRLASRRDTTADAALGYPTGTWAVLPARLEQRIEAHGGRVLIDRPVARIATDGDRFVVWPAAAGSFRRGGAPGTLEPASYPETYDAVLATVAADAFERMLDSDTMARLDAEFRKRVGAAEFGATVCLLVELDRRLTSFHRTAIAEPSMPFASLVEHTNFIDPGRCRGRRFVYLSRNCAPDDPLGELGPDELLDLCVPGLRRVNPAFDRSWIKGRWLSREPAARPIVSLGYAGRIPPIATGIPRLLLVNSTQVYPDDRRADAAVRLAEDAVAALLAVTG